MLTEVASSVLKVPMEKKRLWEASISTVMEPVIIGYFHRSKVAATSSPVTQTEKSLLTGTHTTIIVSNPDATQVADKVFEDVHDSEFTGYVNKVTISIPE